ncbi:MAG TPA: helix-hairpin-helix domain-containing protein [Candidatus Eremiobacteraceae bacterium]|nr:helix-hairpin-helix domain-containing protein [Candidatus Eremiobacteraceae bacterium]
MDRSAIVKLLFGSAAAAALFSAGMFVPRLQSQAPQVSATDQATVPPQLTAAPALDGGTPLPAASTSTSVAVYVCGAVRKAGVYMLDSGTREVDAITKAGGAAANADLEQLNLAQPLSDGMKIDVPVKGQIIAQGSSDSNNATLEPVSTGAATRRGDRHRASRGGSHKLREGQTVDINTATESELTQLPGVGPSLAGRIVEYRQSNGPFQTPDDLQNVSGIGPSKFAKMQPFIRI